MQIQLVSVASKTGSGPAAELARLYMERLAAYTQAQLFFQPSEASLLASLNRKEARTRPWIVLLDGAGRALSSEEWARSIDRERSGGRQLGVFAIGPADGWPAPARAQANLLLSLGPITLPHELARAVAAEQLYRAHTILAGHPYHAGH